MSIPEKVYKYRDWKNGFHKNILIYNELYLASPKDFNDPFDCRIPPNFIDITNEEKDRYINDIAISQFKETVKKGLDVSKRIKDFEKKFEIPEKAQKEYEELLYKEQDKYYGVLALSSRWNSILMWSHYSNCHKGFCVGFWEEKLRTSGYFDKAGIVNYDTKFPHIKPKVITTREEVVEQSFIQTHTKSEDWTYESEYRLMKNYNPEIPESFERTINVSEEVISEVILGINISKSDKAEIVKLCRKKNLPVYQAKPKPFMFEIRRELIE